MSKPIMKEHRLFLFNEHLKTSFSEATKLVENQKEYAHDNLMWVLLLHYDLANEILCEYDGSEPELIIAANSFATAYEEFRRNIKYS